MRRLLPLLLALPVAAGVGCEGTVQPTGVGQLEAIRSVSGGVTASSSGGGYFSIGTLDIQFAYTAVQTEDDGTATGQAHHSVVLGGELIEFYTRVTCLTVDPENGRAWIGGVVTQNNSTHSSFTGAVHEPGRDIWFRVVDYGEGETASQADRSTFVGFEGSAGFITSQEYCDAQPWPADDARTNPVTEGNLQVRAQ